MHRHVTSRNQGTFSRWREDPGNEIEAVTIRHYSPLFVTVRHYSSLFAIRDYSLFAVRYCSLFAVRCSLFAIRCSLFAIRDYSLFVTIRYSLFGYSRHPNATLFRDALISSEQCHLCTEKQNLKHLFVTCSHVQIFFLDRIYKLVEHK